MTPPETKDIEALRGMKATIDPSISYNFANLRREYENSFNNPLGGYTTPHVRDQSVRANNERLSQAQSQAMQEGQYAADNANYGRQATVAGMTAPQMVQSGGTTTQSGGFWSGLLTTALGAGIGGAAANPAGFA